MDVFKKAVLTTGHVIAIGYDMTTGHVIATGYDMTAGHDVNRR